MIFMVWYTKSLAFGHDAEDAGFFHGGCRRGWVASLWVPMTSQYDSENLIAFNVGPLQL